MKGLQNAPGFCSLQNLYICHVLKCICCLFSTALKWRFGPRLFLFQRVFLNPSHCCKRFQPLLLGVTRAWITSSLQYYTHYIPSKLHRHSRHSPWKCDTPCSPSPPNKKTLLGSFKNHPTIMWLREAQKLNRLVLTVDSILPYESLNAPGPMGLKLKCRGISLFQLVKYWETGSIHPPNLLNAWQVEKNHQLKYIYLSWRSNLLQPKKQWVKHFNDFSNKALLVYIFTAVFHPNLSPPSLHRPTLPFQSGPDG